MKYEIINTDKNTAWNVGTKVTRVSDWCANGYALFTDDEHPGASIGAQLSEVRPIDEHPIRAIELFFYEVEVRRPDTPNNYVLEHLQQKAIANAITTYKSKWKVVSNKFELDTNTGYHVFTVELEEVL